MSVAGPAPWPGMTGVYAWPNMSAGGNPPWSTPAGSGAEEAAVCRRCRFRARARRRRSALRVAWWINFAAWSEPISPSSMSTSPSSMAAPAPADVAASCSADDRALEATSTTSPSSIHSAPGSSPMVPRQAAPSPGIYDFNVETLTAGRMAHSALQCALCRTTSWPQLWSLRSWCRSNRNTKMLG